MKKYIYYLCLAGLFIVCMAIITLIMTIINIKPGGALMNYGFIVGIGLFVALKPLVKKILKIEDTQE